MGSKAVKDAIDGLGKYFGIRSADAFLNAVLGESLDLPFPLDPPAGGSLGPRGKLINAICGAGDTSAPTTEALLSWCKNQGGTESEKGEIKLEDFAADVCITPHNDTGIDAGTMPVNAPEVTTSGGKACKDQGMGKPKNGSYYTLNDVRTADLDNESTKVSVIQVFPAAGNVANSDTDVTALFMNAIPTLEMARAVPFIDIMTIVQAGDDLNQTREMSLGRWLMGEDISGESDLVKGTLNAEDIGVTVDPESDKAQFRTAASMEIFTSPQTMISQQLVAEGKTQDAFRPFLSLMSLKLNVAGAGGMFSYKSGDLELVLHDKSKLGEVAPLITPGANGRVRFVITYGWSHPDGTGFMGSFAAGMPRKADPDANRFGQLIDSMKVTETYQVVNTDASFEENGEVKLNLKLSLMGASGMDKFDITLSQTVDIVEEMEATFDNIRKSLLKYSQRPGTTGKMSVPQVVKQGSNMSSARNMKAKDARKLLAWTTKRKGKDPIVADIDKFCRTIFGKNGTGGLKKSLNATKDAELSTMVTHMQKTSDPFLRPAGTYGGKIGSRKYPVARDLEAGKFNQDTVSLGKILSVFMAESIGASEQFTEVQLVFHAFNDSASYMYDYNIAQFPILKSDLESILKKRFNSLGSMTLAAFLDLLNTFFISDPAAMGFGFDTGNIYGARDTKNLTQRKLNSKAKQKKFVMEDHRRGVLQVAYGITETERGGITFKQPQLSAKIQSYPSRDGVIEGPESKPQPDKNILKVQIFDQQCNTVETLYQLFQGFAGAGIMTKLHRPGAPPGSPSPARGPRHADVIQNQMTILEKDREIIVSAEELIDAEKEDPAEGMTIDDLKKFAKDKYRIKATAIQTIKNTITDLSPSLIWGGASAGLISAKLSTQNDPALASINMMRGAGAEPDKGQDGIPMQIMPTELQVEMMGCPYVSFGQQYFVDFGTDSTADNFYGVVGVDHNIAGGEFKTSVKMINLQAFGRFRSPFDSIAELALAAHIAKKKK